MRGEYLFSNPLTLTFLGSPPLARGILNFHNPYVSSPRITPACAGNTMEEFYKQNMTEDHPRLRGEYKPKFKIFKCSRGSPPLARGIQGITRGKQHRGRITPACAGNTHSLSLSIRSSKDHPRLRGEYHQLFSQIRILIGSPPLARGIQR